jgi:hypothetical protein
MNCIFFNTAHSMFLNSILQQCRHPHTNQPKIKLMSLYRHCSWLIQNWSAIVSKHKKIHMTSDYQMCPNTSFHIRWSMQLQFSGNIVRGMEVVISFSIWRALYIQNDVITEGNAVLAYTCWAVYCGSTVVHLHNSDTEVHSGGKKKRRSKLSYKIHIIIVILKLGL